MTYLSRINPWATVGLIVLFAFGAQTAEAAQPVNDDTFGVLPDQIPRTLSFQELQQNDEFSSRYITFTAPVHGDIDVSLGSQTVTYTPHESFWVTGSDSFTYTVSAFGSAVGTATVFLVAEVHGSEILYEDFEDGSFHPWVVPIGYQTQVQITEDAAIDGNFGLQVTSEGYIVYDQGGGGGKGDDNGSIKIDTRSPFPDDPFRLPFGESAEILAIGTAIQPDVLQVLIREDETMGFQVGLDAPYLATPTWLPVSDDALTIVVDWWTDGIGGVLLAIEGESAILLEDIGIAGLELIQYRVGAIGAAPLTTFMDFDNILIRCAEGSTPAYLSLGDDGFENGVSPFWTNSSSTSVQVTQAAALTGDWGLDVDLGFQGVSETYLDASLTEPQQRFRARFLFDPNAITLGKNGLVIFTGHQPDLTGTSSLVRLRLGYQGGSYRIRAEYGAWNTTAWYTLTDEPQTLELQWRAASRPEAADGSLTLWVDGEVVRKINGLATGTARVHALRLGVDAPNGSFGSLYYDNFESWIPTTPLFSAGVTNP